MYGFGNPTPTNNQVNWSLGLILNLSAGTHVFDVRAIYNNGSSCAVSGPITNPKQGTLMVTILKT